MLVCIKNLCGYKSNKFCKISFVSAFTRACLVGVLGLQFASMQGCASVSGYDDSNYQKNALLDDSSCEFVSAFDPKDDLAYNGSYYGLLARTCKDYKRSNEIFDMVEEHYKYEEDLEGNMSKAARAVGTFLVNEASKEYQSYDFERSMINIYKALNFLALDDMSAASAEINRALRRDDMLGEKYLALQAEADKSIAQNSGKDNTNEILSELNQRFAKYKLYKNNINPLGKYLRSVLYIIEGDGAKASDLLRELVVEEGGQNKLILDEYKLANNVANGKARPKYIWLIYENGMSPTITSGYMQHKTKKEVKLIGSGLTPDAKPGTPHKVITLTNTSTLTVPIMQDGASSYEYLSLNGTKTTLVSNMNAVMANELQKKLSSIVSTTIYSKMTKDALTVGATLLGGGLPAMMLMGAYTQATDTADARVFVGLPNSFDIARVPNNGRAIIKDSLGHTILNTNTDTSKDIIIHVKSRDFDNTIVYMLKK